LAPLQENTVESVKSPKLSCTFWLLGASKPFFCVEPTQSVSHAGCCDSVAPAHRILSGSVRTSAHGCCRRVPAPTTPARALQPPEDAALPTPTRNPAPARLAARKSAPDEKARGRALREGHRAAHDRRGLSGVGAAALARAPAPPHALRDWLLSVPRAPTLRTPTDAGVASLHGIRAAAAAARPPVPTPGTLSRAPPAACAPPAAHAPSLRTMRTRCCSQ
jgi:hypothetical protein